LESLAIEGVPKLIETNARHYEDRAFNLYAVSTLVVGTTLRELSERAYTPEQAIKWTADLCDILCACREAGIRHRDIKPENCILGKDGKLYLVDFGLASDVNEQGVKRRSARRSATGSFVCQSSDQRVRTGTILVRT
jgi:serine/threonine-protein kinase